MRRLGMMALLAILGTRQSALGQLPRVVVSRTGEVVQLRDLNGDGDYLDFGEVTTYATGLPAGLGAVAAQADKVFVVDGPSATVYLLIDLNGDGDALDFGEATVYTQPPGGMPPPNLVGLACDSGGACYSVETATVRLYRFEDSSGDGDALDFGEAVVAAEGLSDALAIAARPDDVLLAARKNAAAPVTILQDRNGDGDFLDFAENINYAENLTPGVDIVAPTVRIAYQPRPGEARIVRLQDLTGDDDVLDFGEVVSFAESVGSAWRLAAQDADNVFVAANDAGGSVYLLRDFNHDGDAMDFGEMTLVAQGVNAPAGIAVIAAGSTCVAGDLTADGQVTLDDTAPFVTALLDHGAAAKLCRVDVNGDGLIDGRDIRAFVAALTG